MSAVEGPRLVAVGRAAPGLAEVAILACALAALAAKSGAPLPDDVAWLLTVCERMIAGQRLYVDIAELNPPMSAWLYLPFVRLAQLVGVSADKTVACAVIGFGLAMIYAAERILVAARLIEGRTGWRAAATLAMVVAPIAAFGQRDHVAAMAVLPILAAIAARATGAPAGTADRLLAGLAAGLAMAIKPHFAVAIALPALYALAKRRELRSVFALEYLTAATVVICYSGAAFAAYPEFFVAMLPIAREVYLPNRLDLMTLATTVDMIETYALVGVLVMTRPAFALRPLYATLLLAALGFALAFLAQGKGWHYQAQPALSLAMIAFALSLFDRARYIGVISMIFARAFAVLLVVAPVVEWRGWREADAAMVETLRPFGPHLKIALLSATLPLASPLHRTLGATLVNRGPCLWMAGNAIELSGRDPSRAQLAERASAAERATFLEDVSKTPPDIILTHGGAVDWLAWARRDQALAAVLDQYRPIATLPAYGVNVIVLKRQSANG